DIVIKDIKPWNSVVALGLLRLFLNRNCPTIGAEFDNTIALRVTDLITKNRCTAVEIGKRALKSVAAVENVIAKNQRYCIIPDKRFSDQKRLRDYLRFRLLEVLN